MADATDSIQNLPAFLYRFHRRRLLSQQGSAAGGLSTGWVVRTSGLGENRFISLGLGRDQPDLFCRFPPQGVHTSLLLAGEGPPKPLQLVPRQVKWPHAPLRPCEHNGSLRGDDEHPGELFGITAVQARLGQKVFEAFGPGCEHLQQNVVSLPRRAQKGRGAAP